MRFTSEEWRFQRYSSVSFTFKSKAKADTIYEDKLDKQYLEKHKKLITSVYHALDGLRIILSTHPDVKEKSSKPCKQILSFLYLFPPPRGGRDTGRGWEV